MVTLSPDLHAFFANEVCTGMKLVSAPIDDPPRIASTITKMPRMPFQERGAACSTIRDKVCSRDDFWPSEGNS